MNESITSYSFYSDKTEVRNLFSHRERKSPSEKTLMFLKLFARNYRASSLLPESLPGFVLG